MGITAIHILCVVNVYILLPTVAHSDVSSYFAKVPPSVIYVQTGKTARFEWEIQSSLYSQRNTRFASYTPKWYFKIAGVQTQIAYDWKKAKPPWKWTIAPDCPGRYLNPTRVSKLSTANLVISNITLEDDGTYQCTLELSIPLALITSSARLVVTVPPQFNPKPPPTKIIMEGQDLILPCTAVGSPTPNITWVQMVGHVSKSTGRGSATLRISTIRRDQNGTYECQAWNNPNERPVTAQTAVKVNFSTGPITITITEVDASFMTVTWTKPADDGGSPVTGYLLEVSTKPPVITVNTHAVITGLKADTLYTVNVFARNAVGYGAVSSKGIRTKKKGKPAVPDLSTALLQAKGSKLSVVLTWEEPDNNGGNLTRYTIYKKEVARKAEWTKYDDVTNPKPLEYRITKNIVYGKTYMFMVTAWNEYGESVKDEGSAKTVNTTATKAASRSGLYERIPTHN